MTLTVGSSRTRRDGQGVRRKEPMSFAEILVAIAVCTAIFGSYCATGRIVLPIDDRARGTSGSGSPRLHFVSRREFSSLAKSTHDQILFNLQSSQFIRNHAN